ncbi:hypothetical protein LB506_005060 [Fusarium annulatum]|nr:hypothetical protein LB506_005060 [Fusarium annulatum]
MERYAKVFMAPRKPDPGDKGVSIFLAGITTSTDRPDWDSTWKEDFSDKRWEEQVWWELDMQEAADIIVFMFHPSTDAPISLMELGLAVKSKSKRIIVCAQDGYRKKGNVEAVCRRYGAKLVNTGNELRDAIIATLEDGHK